MVITYPIKSGLYVNLTNRCPCACTFCLRQNAPGVGGSGSLWLPHEPTLAEATASLDSWDLATFDELVFCGYGEPTERLDDLLALAVHAKERRPDLRVRVNTNGLADLIHGEPTAPRLKGIVDAVSISLNTPDPETYLRMCRPRFGIGSWQAMLDYARSCKAFVPDVVMTVVGPPVTNAANLARCEAIVRELGVRLRVRPYEAKADSSG